MRKEQPHPSQNLPASKAGITATPATGEMLPKALQCSVINFEQGKMTMACPTNKMLSRTDVLTGRYPCIAALKQMTGEALKP
ncbi:MAG: hypothetical protein WCE63_02200 [Acidobacteriaceae bacterium]